MANITTGVGSLGNYNAGTNTYGTAGLLQKAYDKALDFKLRAEPMLRSIADKKPGSLTNNSNQVIFQIYKDLAVEKTPLDEVSDPDTLGMETPDYIAVVMKEYGNMVARTKASKMFSFTDIDPAIANIVAYNMIDSIDTMVADVLVTGSQVLYGTGGTTTPTASGEIDAIDTFTSAEVRRAIAKLRTDKVVPRRGNLYWAGIHPEVSHDFRVESDAAAWRTPQNYQATDKLWSGEIGTFEGAYFVESPRMPFAYSGASTGAGGTPTYTGTGTSGAFTIVLTAAVSATTNVGYLVTGTNVGTGARIASISSDRKTLTLTVANSGAISAGTITVQPTIKVYSTLLAGQQALAEAVAEEPHSVIAPVTDNFNRFHKVGWYGALGWSLYRTESLWRVESSSSIA